ncbi:MAG: C40 family peptidase [Brumimicrobium sp.]|nr:C40 family peptidase [Brumimicrobium sp.]
MLTVIPVRADKSDTSEIVTQLLFGEIATVLEKHNQWLKVNIHHDGYVGWIDEKQVIEISEEAFNTLSIKKTRQTIKSTTCHTPWGTIEVLQGSPVLCDQMSCEIDTLKFSYKEPLEKNELNPEQPISEISLSYLNAPYLWGGRTHYGIDCSGFTQTVFAQKGYALMRDASQQVKQGEPVNFNDIRTGDLAFFVSSKGNITHVGIILEDGKIIHASGRVRIDMLTEEGIYNSEKKKITHKLHSIRRLGS